MRKVLIRARLEYVASIMKIRHKPIYRSLFVLIKFIRYQIAPNNNAMEIPYPLEIAKNSRKL
jgi:hypothetical protein